MRDFLHVRFLDVDVSVVRMYSLDYFVLFREALVSNNNGTCVSHTCIHTYIHTRAPIGRAIVHSSLISVYISSAG